MPVADQQFTFGFDYIANGRTAVFAGNQHGCSLRSGNYTANNLNCFGLS